MSFETHLNDVLDSLLTTPLDHPISKEQLIQTMDLTLLNEHASPEALDYVLHQALTYPVAAVCVFINHLSLFRQASSDLRLATVINFPKGDASISASLSELETAIHLGADEIDYVFPYQSYLAGNKKEALDQCAKIAEECKKQNRTLKVILETCAYPNAPTIYQLSQEILALPVDFLKTSTGKSTGGATFSAAFAMLSAIKEADSQCGIKISGGVKTIQQARNYTKLAELMHKKAADASWFRIGASNLLTDMTA
jgi:deoxyribose-phosphate aldolase